MSIRQEKKNAAKNKRLQMIANWQNELDTRVHGGERFSAVMRSIEMTARDIARANPQQANDVRFAWQEFNRMVDGMYPVVDNKVA